MKVVNISYELMLFILWMTCNHLFSTPMHVHSVNFAVWVTISGCLFVLKLCRNIQADFSEISTDVYFFNNFSTCAEVQTTVLTRRGGIGTTPTGSLTPKTTTEVATTLAASTTTRDQSSPSSGLTNTPVATRTTSATRSCSTCAMTG